VGAAGRGVDANSGAKCLTVCDELWVAAQSANAMSCLPAAGSI